MSGLRRRRQVQRQVVGRRADVVERHQLDAEAGGDLLGDDTDRARRRACRTRARAAPLPGRCARGRRRRASCRAARCRETSSFPIARPSSRDRRPAPMRASASISAQACSATLMLLAPGALTTRMPRALAAATSTLSTPVPARAMMRRSRRRVDQRRGRPWSRCGRAARRRPRGRRRAPPACARSARRRPSRLRRGAAQRRRREVVGDDDLQWDLAWLGSDAMSDVVDDVPDLVRRQLALRSRFMPVASRRRG